MLKRVILSTVLLSPFWTSGAQGAEPVLSFGGSRGVHARGLFLQAVTGSLFAVGELDLKAVISNGFLRIEPSASNADEIVSNVSAVGFMLSRSVGGTVLSAGSRLAWHQPGGGQRLTGVLYAGHVWLPLCEWADDDEVVRHGPSLGVTVARGFDLAPLNGVSAEIGWAVTL